MSQPSLPLAEMLSQILSACINDQIASDYNAKPVEPESRTHCDGKVIRSLKSVLDHLKMWFDTPVNQWSLPCTV